MIEFVLPSEKDRDGVLAFYKEFEDNSETCIGYANHDDYDKWLNMMIDRKNGTNLPEGFVRENFYVCLLSQR